jgi:hypothetical protein
LSTANKTRRSKADVTATFGIKLTLTRKKTYSRHNKKLWISGSEIPFHKIVQNCGLFLRSLAWSFLKKVGSWNAFDYGKGDSYEDHSGQLVNT